MSSIRRILVTLLDAAAIVAGSAALVISLGGGTRIGVAGFRISLRGTANALIVFGCLAALRLLIARRDSILPAIARPDPDRLEAERVRFAAPERATAAVWMYAAATLAGSIVWVVPHLLNLRAVPDPGDPILSAWRLAAVVHQLFSDPRHLWDGNIFYPLRDTLTYSDSTFLQALLVSPLLLAGFDPLRAVNLLMVVSYPARGLAYFVTAWRLTGDPRAATVAGLLGAWSPFHPQHYSQLELQWTLFVPLSLLTLMRMLAAPHWKTGLRFGAAVAAQCLAGMYVAVMLVTALVPFGAIVALGWRVRPTRQLGAALLAAIAVLGPVVGGLGVAYMRSRDAHGDRGWSEVSEGSALPYQYGHAHVRLVTHRWQAGGNHKPERELFPGVSTIALAAIGMVPPLTAATAATLVSGAIAFDSSLGANGLVYDDMFRASAVYRGMRVVARFSAIVQAMLVLLAAYGARRLIDLGRRAGASGVVCAALCAIVLVDLRMDPGLVEYYKTVPSMYSRVTPDMVLAEFPRERDVDYMYFSTRHWARLLGGYSGFFPSNEPFARASRAFPLPVAIEELRGLGVTHVTYNCALEQDQHRCSAIFDALDANAGLELVASERWSDARVSLYRLK